MADLPVHPAPGRAPAIRIDMTPMVDLAFLLLTFFVLTTSLRRLEGLDLLVPLGAGPGMEHRSLTFLLAGRDSIFGYAGPFDPVTTPPKRLGRDQVNAALKAIPDTTDLQVVVKPLDRTRYQDLVRMVDLLERHGLRRRAVQEGWSQAEQNAVAGMAPTAVP
ncbi:MAG: biopolymer transporter ExbD [Flavobacteriales bacterium]